MDDVMDLDAEGDVNDTFGGDFVVNTTAQLVNNVRRDTGLQERSPSPAGSASSLEGLHTDIDVSTSRKRKDNGRSQKQMSASSVAKITMNAVKETMKLMNHGKRRKVAESSTDSEDDQNPIMIDKTFKVKDNGHDILDFEVRNNKCEA